MPECLDCGNDSVFLHHVSGTQHHYYDDDGSLTKVEDDSIATERVTCGNAECESGNVRVENE